MKMESKRSQAALRRIVCLVVLAALLCALPALAFAAPVDPSTLSPEAGVYGWQLVLKSDPNTRVGTVGYPNNAWAGNTPQMNLDSVLDGITRYGWYEYEIAVIDPGLSPTLNGASDYERFAQQLMDKFALKILLIDADDTTRFENDTYPYAWVDYDIAKVDYTVDLDQAGHIFNLQPNAGRQLYWDYSQRNGDADFNAENNHYKASFGVTVSEQGKLVSNKVSSWGVTVPNSNAYVENISLSHFDYNAPLEWPYTYKNSDPSMKDFAEYFKKNYHLRVARRIGYNPDEDAYDEIPVKSMEIVERDGNRVIMEIKPAIATSLRWHWHDWWVDTSNNWNVDKEYNLVFRIAVNTLPAVSDATAKKHLVTDSVVNPPYTTVNFFDYWLEPGGRWENDFERYPQGTEAEVITKGINNDHLLVFMGSFAFPGAVGAGNVSDLGRWNVWTGDESYAPYPDGGDLAGGFGTPPAGSFRTGDPDGILKPHRGIVQRKLVGGYPKLALGGAAWMTTDTHFSANRARSFGNEYPDEMGGNFRTFYSDVLAKDGGNAKGGESLAYLFDPGVSNPYKASVTDARGLFQLDNEGYFYYNSRENFAELVEHGGSDGSNIVNLYDEPWKVSASVDVDNASSATKGQFFPFNNWKSLFHETANGGVAQDHYTFRDQNRTTGLPLNHYFGMTVETEFGQPVDGIVKSSNARATGREMEFYFSGDDDAWVFIDDVLVGDIGGIHTPVSIDINFATGNIRYTALDAPGGEQQYYTTTLKQMFDDAGATGVQWKKAKSGGYIFPDGSTHTLKFFYMERGNDVSNCSLRFNTLPWEDGSGVPATGDSSHMPLWLTLIALFLCAMAASLILPYRRRPSSARGE